MCPLVNDEYINPGWTNGASPAIDDSELNAISDTLLKMGEFQGLIDNVMSALNAVQIQIEAIAVQIASINTSISVMRSDTLTFFNTNVVTAAWTTTGLYGDYPWSADIATANVTTLHVPHVNFSLADISSGNFAPICASKANAITIYAKTRPTGTITLPTIVASRRTPT